MSHKYHVTYIAFGIIHSFTWPQ